MLWSRAWSHSDSASLVMRKLRHKRVVLPRKEYAVTRALASTWRSWMTHRSTGTMAGQRRDPTCQVTTESPLLFVSTYSLHKTKGTLQSTKVHRPYWTVPYRHTRLGSLASVSVRGRGCVFADDVCGHSQSVLWVSDCPRNSMGNCHVVGPDEVVVVSGVCGRP